MQNQSEFEIYSRVRDRLHEQIEDCRPALPPTEGNLFHYTNASGLIGIISTSTLWATAQYYLNDPQEWLYGADLAVHVLRRVGGDINHPVDEVLGRVVDFLESETVDGGWFVSCFCQDGDQLSQWRNYADQGGGYCVEFDFAEVQLWANRNTVSLIQVEYDRKTQEQLLEQHIRTAVQKLSLDGATNSDPEDIWIDAAEQQLRTVVLPLVLRFKHPAFSNEGERRLAYLLGTGTSGFYPEIRYRPGRGFVVPYLPLSMTDSAEKLPILSVRCGPTTHPLLGLSGVEALLKTNGYRSARKYLEGKEVAVLASAVPYRG